jgi:hypothetical protein
MANKPWLYIEPGRDDTIWFSTWTEVCVCHECHAASYGVATSFMYSTCKNCGYTGHSFDNGVARVTYTYIGRKRFKKTYERKEEIRLYE